MKQQKNSVANALTNLASISLAKPALAPQAPVGGVQAADAAVFPELTVERVSVHFFAPDLKAIEAVVAAARAAGRRKVSQSQAIRTLIRTGGFDLAAFDAVQAEDGRRKAHKTSAG